MILLNISILFYNNQMVFLAPALTFVFFAILFIILNRKYSGLVLDLVTDLSFIVIAGFLFAIVPAWQFILPF